MDDVAVNRVKMYQDKRHERVLFKNAFRTKTGINNKVSTTHTFKDNPKIYMHQVFEPDTWMCDIINLGKYSNRPVGYFLFVHCNSRYVVLSVGSLQDYDEDIYEFLPTGIKSTSLWLDTMRKILNEHNSGTPHRISTLITDYEPGWKSNVANSFYEEHHIKHEAINVSQEGHYRLGILDRAVRTLRDMIYNTNIDVDNPIEIQRLIRIYNETKHSTLSKYLNAPTRPVDVFLNTSLEAQLIQELKSQNYLIMTRPDYDIPDGSEVVVKQIYANNLDKHRRSERPGRWIVVDHFGNRYKVKNIDNGDVIDVFRSLIRRA